MKTTEELRQEAELEMIEKEDKIIKERISEMILDIKKSEKSLKYAKERLADFLAQGRETQIGRFL